MTEEEIIVTYGTTVYAIAVNHVRSRYDADAVYSEVFLRYFRKNRRFESEEQRKACLIRLTVNCAKKFLANRERWDSLPGLENERMGRRGAGHDELCSLHETLDRLQPEERDLVYFFYDQGMKSVEIAAATGLSDDVVRAKLKRVRDKMKNLMTP